mgnify:CR=1 FL=1
MGYDLLCSGLMDLEGNKIPESSTEIRLEYEEEPDVPEEPEVRILLLSPPVVSVLMR